MEFRGGGRGGIFICKKLRFLDDIKGKNDFLKGVQKKRYFKIRILIFAFIFSICTCIKGL